MADCKKYDGSTWEHSLRKLTTATEAVENPLYSDGTAITSYNIKGNEEHTGTPTPSNPVDVNGVGVRTENLFDKNDVLQDYRIGADGEPFRDSLCAMSGYIEVTPNTIVNQNYSFGFNDCMAEYDENKTFIIRYTSGNGKITTSSSTKYIRVAVVKTRLDETMVTMGAITPSSYEPYGYKIPILTNQQTIDIYIGDLPLLKSLDGTAVDEISNGTLTRRVDSGGSVLPTPTTTQITMPSIPTTEGANSITVDTTVQPSEFTATWTGWHDASVKEWDGSDWQ